MIVSVKPEISHLALIRSLKYQHTSALLHKNDLTDFRLHTVMEKIGHLALIRSLKYQHTSALLHKNDLTDFRLHTVTEKNRLSRAYSELEASAYVSAPA